MIVKELIRILQDLDPNSLVVVSSDSEGNNFSLMDVQYSTGYFDLEYNEYYSDPEDEDNIDDEEMADLPSGVNPCVVLWSTK